VGGLIGGFIFVELAKHHLGVGRRTGDLFAIPLCIGIAIGRIGCFSYGPEDHTGGVATRLPWGVNFGDGIPRHPTQLYEVLFALTLGVFLWRRSKQPHTEGDLFRLFMVGYFSFRLICDFLKPDDARIFAGLTAISVGVCPHAGVLSSRHRSLVGSSQDFSGSCVAVVPSSPLRLFQARRLNQRSPARSQPASDVAKIVRSMRTHAH